MAHFVKLRSLIVKKSAQSTVSFLGVLGKATEKPTLGFNDSHSFEMSPIR
jgi:hypothetical protein